MKVFFLALLLLVIGAVACDGGNWSDTACESAGWRAVRFEQQCNPGPFSDREPNEEACRLWDELARDIEEHCR